ncbi:hypothetical protein CDAR_516341 [Caerostris darwini]|uniref:Reverse transcriptase/retrotransposon-derived protein RNase H-like domain-containing protein n=1 Tax=Caerostris darwini TaxID=1538125 RepID=A0AAV4WYL4_9ARAC|nr:hypothetical protein CDAR_516341 [Caerostris darwini]
MRLYNDYPNLNVITVAGHWITPKGLEVDLAKVEAIISIPPSKFVKQHSFSEANKLFKTFPLRTDVNNYALGSVRFQTDDKTNDHDTEYANRLLTAAERNYSTTEGLKNPTTENFSDDGGA